MAGSGMADLFGPAVARSMDPQTSHDAAEAVTPATGAIRQQVEAFAFSKADRGFIDEELSKAFDDAEKSSYRTRRAELTEAGTIIDSGLMRLNGNDRQCIVWVHKAFAEPRPKAIIRTVDDRTKANAKKVHAALSKAAKAFYDMGGASFAKELQEAADLAKAWTL